MTKEERKEYMRKWWVSHPGYKRKYWADNSETLKEQQKERSKSEKFRVWHNKYNIEWAKRNKATCNARIKAYKLQKVHATPPWADLKQIERFYILSKKMEDMFGVKYHVDHIWPIKGKTFCGLHVPWNLQLLPASENCSKQNKTPIHGTNTDRHIRL